MKTVLSIQSHVVHGYVGGRAAIFPLQSQGWEVDNINTVNFSNHTGYGSFSGTSLAPEELDSILTQLETKLNVQYRALVTGYIPNADLIRTLSLHLPRLKRNGGLYLLDPVLGDNNYMYVDKSCIKEYQNILSLENLVDIITPNQFELELLTGLRITCKSSLIQAIDKLHQQYNIPYIVITSVNGDIFSSSNDDIYCVVSNKDQGCKVFKVPMIKSYFTGVGDLFSALLLDRLEKNNMDLSSSVNQVLTIVNLTLKLTHKSALLARKAAITSSKSSGDNAELIGKINDADTMKYLELRIIQAREYYGYDGPGEFVEMDLDLLT
ncbi:putative pyridoxal kinase BUD16 [Spathaspora sp. JA1]|nr:putative pyridoxal kinase BUD16 [Spathaspora sp. JA1]